MKLKVDRKVMDYLQEFDLTEREVIVYLTLLRTGPNTIMNLARETGIKRSTTHNNVEELVNKGLVSQTNYGERRMVVAEEPEKLKILVEEKKWRTKKLEDNMQDAIKSIYDMIPSVKGNTAVDVKYYNGEKGFKEVCQRSIDFATDEILFISNYTEWAKVYTKEYDEQHYIPTRVKKGVNLRMIANENDFSKGEISRDEKKLRKIKLLEKEFKVSTTIIIYGEEVSLMVPSEPYLSIVINSKEIADSFRNMFENMWIKL